jgi:uncharacterized protein
MSTEAVVPFALASDGSIQATSDPNAQSQQHLTSLLSTAPTERVMVPTYGVPVKSTVFAPDDEIAVNQLQKQIQAAIATWEPNLSVNSVSVVGAGDANDPANISVDWSINAIQNANSRGVLTATILVGGLVVEGGNTQ